MRLLKKLRRIWKDFSVYSGVDEDGEITKQIEAKHGNHGTCGMEREGGGV